MPCIIRSHELSKIIPALFKFCRRIIEEEEKDIKTPDPGEKDRKKVILLYVSHIQTGKDKENTEEKCGDIHAHRQSVTEIELV